MEILQLTDERFQKYGRIVDEINFAPLFEAAKQIEIPAGVVYEPGLDCLEQTSTAKELESKSFGELAIQIGHCSGHNTKLNAVEYHRSSEMNIAVTPAILMLGKQEDITLEGTYDTSKMEAFYVPEKTAVLLHATTLHYAPCDVDNKGFKVLVVLPKGTNLALDHKPTSGEDRLLAAKNKWLIGHEEGGLSEDAYIGLVGENLDLNN